MIRRFAAIYIGSSKCEMVVGQRGAKGGINILDRMFYPIDFGEQSFSKGEIDFESVRGLCGILNEYIEVAQASDVEELEIVGTAALREAANQSYLLEQIRISTGGYQVHLLEKGQEVELIYKHTLLKCETILTKEVLERDTMLSALTSGNMALVLMHQGVIDYSAMLGLGYMKRKAIFLTIEEQTENFEKLLSDFMDASLRRTQAETKKRKIKNLVITSHDVDAIAKLCDLKKRQGCYLVSREDFIGLYREVVVLSANQILRKYPMLTPFESETIRHTLMVFLKHLDAAAVDEMILVPLSFCDALLDFKFNVTKRKALDAWIEAGALSCADRIEKKYYKDQAHTAYIEFIAMKIFDGLKKKYELTKREQFLLQVATRLLDVGHYIGNYSGEPCNRVIIDNEGIIGISEAERCILGEVADGVRLIPFDAVRIAESGLSVADKLSVSRLIAILKLATALDKSHKQKIGRLQCRLENDRLIITVFSSVNIQLEAYYFDLTGRALKRVFGLTPVLKIKREKE